MRVPLDEDSVLWWGWRKVGGLQRWWEVKIDASLVVVEVAEVSKSGRVGHS